MKKTHLLLTIMYLTESRRIPGDTGKTEGSMNLLTTNNETHSLKREKNGIGRKDKLRVKEASFNPVTKKWW